MALLIVDGQVNCDEDAARRFVGMTETMFDEYKRKRIIQPLRRGVYCYQDLVEAVERIREMRAKVIKLEFQDEETESRVEQDSPEVGSQGHKPRYRSTPELLRGQSQRS